MPSSHFPHVVALLMAASAFAVCPDKKETGRLPAEIGTPGRAAVFGLRCDTVFVPKGATTVVHPGAFLYFEKEKPTNFIRVEGTLELHGTPERRVVIAGGREPGPLAQATEAPRAAI